MTAIIPSHALIIYVNNIKSNEYNVASYKRIKVCEETNADEAQFLTRVGFTSESRYLKAQ